LGRDGDRTTPSRSVTMAKVMTFMGANASVDTHQALTYVIYWRPGKGPNGHSAMIIDSSLTDAPTGSPLSADPDHKSTDNHVSWVGSGGANPFAAQGKANTFYQDMNGGWGGSDHPLGWGVVPTRWVALKGLDIPAMDQEWKAIRAKPNASWKLIDKNCAT